MSGLACGFTRRHLETAPDNASRNIFGAPAVSYLGAPNQEGVACACMHEPRFCGQFSEPGWLRRPWLGARPPPAPMNGTRSMRFPDAPRCASRPTTATLPYIPETRKKSAFMSDRKSVV